MIPAHSPSIAQAYTHSRGVLAVVPSNGVRANPPLVASARFSGTDVVVRKLARLCCKSVIYSSGVLLVGAGAILLLLGARSLLGLGLLLSSCGASSTVLSGSISTVCPLFGWGHDL